jgi:hypothetical protein
MRSNDAEEIQKAFAGQFSGRADSDGKDASDAVELDDYGARHPGEQVSGWGWQARRLRAKQIGRALKANPLQARSPSA